MIGIVTVTYNSAGVLPGFLQSIASQIYGDFLLFAVDNASADGSVATLRDCGDERVRVIANADNRGIAAGNNQGIRAAMDAGCDSVMLLNNDTEFGAEFFWRLVEGLERYQGEAEMVCPKMMYMDEPNRIWAAGGAFRRWFGYGIRHVGENEIDGGQYDRARVVDFVPACCILIRREVFEQVGLMDERYFVYVEDVDLMYRALRKGMRLMYLPEAALFHKVGGLTGGIDSPFSTRYCTRNRVYFLLRHFGVLRALPVLLLYQAHFITGLVYGRFSRRSFAIKEKATWEGFALWREARMEANSRQEPWKARTKQERT